MEKTKMLKVIADYDDNPVDVTAEVNFIKDKGRILLPL